MKPIEAFKCLNNLESNLGNRKYRKENALKDIQIIKRFLINCMNTPTVLDVIKEKCSSGNSNLWLVSCLPNYKCYMAIINDTTNHDHDLVRAEHNELTDDEFHLLKEVIGYE